MSAIQVPPPEVDVIAPKLKLDLACGQVCAEGFEGVDIAAVEGVKHVHDLNVYPWPFETSSVDEVRCSHYLEHLDGAQRIDFFNELYRILKPDSGAVIVCPYAFHARAWGDPTHKSFITEWTFFYASRVWREANKLTHGPYERLTCNLEFSFPWTNVDQGIMTGRSADYQNFAARHYLNTVADIVCQLVARK